jgi:hypothetical protein
LGPHSGREKSGLEGMTQTLTMIGASEGALPCVAGRIKNLNFSFLKVTESLIVNGAGTVCDQKILVLGVQMEKSEQSTWMG